MFLSAILSFLGGSAFRMIWGEVSNYLNKRQDHTHELEMLKMQANLDQQRHTQNLESIRLQSELKVKQISVQSEADIAKGDADAFTAAMTNFGKPSGVKWVDAWNASIRPLFGSLCFFLWLFKVGSQNWKMDEFDVGMMGVIVGFFFADRTLRRNGK